MSHFKLISSAAEGSPARTFRWALNRRPAVAPRLTTALLCATAALAVASQSTSAEASSEAPPLAHRATSLLEASGDATMITLRLECRENGKVTIATVAPKRRLGTTRFTCVRGRAVARLRVPAGAARRARARRSIDAVATVVSGAERSRFELKTPRRGDRTPLARTSSYVPLAWCTGVGFTMSMDNTTRFDAAWGETVWWRPAAFEADLYTGAGGMRNSAYWQSHRAVPGDGMFLIHPGGRIEFTWTVVRSAAYVASRYGVRVYPRYQVYTDRGGYRWYSLGATTGYGYGEQAVSRCDVPWPAGY